MANYLFYQVNFFYEVLLAFSVASHPTPKLPVNLLH
jgi:hypothetical protein